MSVDSCPDVAWPRRVPRSLPVPQCHLFRNVEVSAMRYGDRDFVSFYDTPLTFRRFLQESERIAGYLQQECGVRQGDRVLLYMQNCPQFMLAYYGILRADAVVVPVNPMNLTEELAHCITDSGARVAFVAQELWPKMEPLLGSGLQHAVIVTYGDCVDVAARPNAPGFVTAPRQVIDARGVTPWVAMLALDRVPTRICAGPDDPAVLPYTSGTTGKPKGCVHTHRSTMVNTVSGAAWFGTGPGSVVLAVLPLFHVTGMQGGLNGPMYVGATVVLLARWDREIAAAAIERHRISSLNLITTMVIDFLANPRIGTFDLRSVKTLGGGGAAMPDAVAAALRERLGLAYSEGYGMSETMGATHMSPPDGPRRGSLGVPAFGVDARVVDPVGGATVAAGEVGEIVVHGEQVMRGYWNAPEANRETFVAIDGKRFLRTGDLGRVDADGFFFFVDRIKRMINASGFKVWPAEVEATLYRHPAVQETCVIASPDERRGETVKALVVLRPAFAGQLDAESLMAWARSHMAAYKVPRQVDFVDALPKSASGKVSWRELQDAELQRFLK